MDKFTQAYIECALWSSNDNATEQGGEPLDTNYTLEDIAGETLARMISDCDSFMNAQWSLISSDLERAGHDFWLTRNGHGAGFWDGDWPEEDGKKLTEASKVFGEYDLYIGDDGKVYGS